MMEIENNFLAYTTVINFAGKNNQWAEVWWEKVYLYTLFVPPPKILSNYQ